MDLTVYIDGASRGNPGPASAGVVIRELETQAIVHEAGYLLDQSTNNVAEYRGLIRALEVVKKLTDWDGGGLHIFSDSQLMVRQITGEYRVKSPDLKPLLDEVQFHLMSLHPWQIQHVKRDKNKRADELANMALDAGKDVIARAGDGSKNTGAVPKKYDTEQTSATKSPAGTSSHASTGNTKAQGYWKAWLVKKPGAKCPAKCPSKTPFLFGPKLPEGFCVFATQAVFDENPTLWNISGNSNAQASCPKCNVTIEIEVAD